VAGGGGGGTTAAAPGDVTHALNTRWLRTIKMSEPPVCTHRQDRFNRQPHVCRSFGQSAAAAAAAAFSSGAGSSTSSKAITARPRSV
jgi:hypothetical protein